MKSIAMIFGLLLANVLYAQVSTYPYIQSFEDPFTTGHDVNFLPEWWGNYIVADTMGQYSGFAKSGDFSLFMKPEGEEVSTIAQVRLDLSEKHNNIAEFWVAMRKNGVDEDQKRIKLNVAISYDGGATFPFVTRFGPHEGFLNEDTSFEKFTFVAPPVLDDQSNVVLRFIGKSGGGPHLSGTLLLDDITVTQVDVDTFPPYIMGSELAIRFTNTLVIPFSEPLQLDSALALEHYNFTWPIEEDGTQVVGEGPLPVVSNVELSEDGYSVTLSLNPSLSIGETYALEMYNITDLNGNVADTLLIDGIVYNKPVPGSIVFSEIFFTDPGGAHPMEKLQYVELYNPTTDTIPLGGLRIKGAISAHDLPNIKLKPGEYWVATRNASSYYATFGKTAWQWKGAWIEYDAEEGEEIEPQSLYIQTTDRHSGVLVDSVGFDFNDPDWLALRKLGYSIEVCNNQADNLDVTNWVLVESEPYTYVFDGYEYTVYGTPQAGCTSAEMPYVALGYDGNYCGVDELILDAGNDGSKYLWSTGEITKSITVTRSGNYDVMVNNGHGVAYDTINVSLVPAITATFYMGSSTCALTNTLFESKTDEAVGWLWDFGDGQSSTKENPEHQYMEDGVYEVSLTTFSGFGCTDIVSTTIEVYPNSLSMIVPDILCTNVEVTFSSESVDGETWFWDFGDGTISMDPNPVHIYSDAGDYTVDLMVINSHGCTLAISSDIEVNTADIYWTLPESVCENTEVNFTASRASGLTWLWDFGDGATSTEQNPSHIYTEDGTYVVSVIATGTLGCTTTLSGELNVNDNDIAWTVPGTACQNEAVEFTDDSPNAETWLWDFGDGTIATTQNPTHIYTESGDYIVGLTVINTFGCTATTSTDITVNGLDISLTLPESVCKNTEVVFVASGASGLTWLWDFGDGQTSTRQNPSHIYSEDGTFRVSVTATGTLGCPTTLTEEIYVNENEAKAIMPTLACRNESLIFISDSPFAETWLWDFGDGTTSDKENPTHLFSEAGHYTVHLTTTNAFGCLATSSNDIEIKAVDIFLNLPESACEDAEINFGAMSIPDAIWFWDFGDGETSTGQNPSHIYSEDAAYIVSVTATSTLGCSTTLVEELVVNPNDIGWTLPEAPVCTYTDVYFEAQDGEQWLWNLGDGTTSTQQNVIHSYNMPGDYTISLSATNSFGCTSTAENYLSVSVCLGIESDTNYSGFMMYPNPANDIVTVDLMRPNQGQGHISIINNKGVTILQTPLNRQADAKYTLDVSKIDNGLYLIQVNTGEKITNGRLMIIK